ncbi:sensor histidine kinase [Paenibacillus agricola]|uniref:Sensor histidine kinase n=1 Tax=Paenibacillus agricola TaxID=2716264 RepID=A0ABX0JIK6_9BACL|nr:sensor histidine kinase [Paenibacillus agricola]NHN33716.1 sensor histidine kinase [Paenibacillus agricola]
MKFNHRSFTQTPKGIIKIRDKIILLCVTFFVAFTIIFYFMSYQKSIDILDEQVDVNASSALEQLNLHITYIFNEMDKLSNIISNQHAVNELLYSSLHEPNKVKQIENYFALKPVLSDIITSYNNYYVSIYLPENVLFSQEQIMINAIEAIDTMELYETITKENGKAVWRANLRLSKRFDQYVTSQYKLLKHYYTDNVIGIIEIYTPNRFIEDIMSNVGNASGSITYLIDKEGSVITASASNGRDAKPDAELFGKVMSGSAKGSFKAGEGNQSKQVVYRKLEINGWILITTIPEDLLYTSSKKVRNFSIMTITAVLFIVILLIYLILKNSTKRIDRLIRVMSYIENDGLTTVVPNKVNDELGELEKRFNEMRSRINNLIAEIYRAENTKKEAQFIALQAQINPHFLYNTLDTINWMAINQDAYDVSSIITALSKFFRLTLNAGNEIISVREEIEIVKQYLYIQKIRYDDELEVQYFIDENVLNYNAVKLSLQPLIENALKHGIQHSDRPGKIELRARLRDDGFIEMRVLDNGSGLKKEAQALADVSLDKSGYGLKNVLERLILHFGTECVIEIKDGIEIGVEVIIIWPAKISMK